MMMMMRVWARGKGRRGEGGSKQGQRGPGEDEAVQ
jgi:hypothetical protein